MTVPIALRYSVKWHRSFVAGNMLSVWSPPANSTHCPIHLLLKTLRGEEGGGKRRRGGTAGREEKGDLISQEESSEPRLEDDKDEREKPRRNDPGRKTEAVDGYAVVLSSDGDEALPPVYGT